MEIRRDQIDRRHHEKEDHRSEDKESAACHNIPKLLEHALLGTATRTDLARCAKQGTAAFDAECDLRIAFTLGLFLKAEILQ